MKKNKLAVCTLFALASMSALAQDNMVRVGIVGVTVHSQSPDFTSNGPAFLTPQPAGLDVGNATTVVFGYTRRITEHWDIDFAAGIPPTHKVWGRGTLAPFGVTAEVTQRAPTLFANYNFGVSADKFRPFVGLGLNYTQFFDAQSTASGNIATGGPTKISLSDSYGLAAQLGFNYKLADRWFLNGSVATAKVKTDMTATTGSIERKTTIDLRPVAFSMSLGYSF